MYSCKFFNVLFTKKCIMEGKTIKDVLAQRGIAQAEIAKLLGTTPNNLNNMLAKDDVRTGLLESIAQAANLPISVFYGETYTISGGNNATGNHSTNTVNSSNDDRILSLLLTKDEQLTLAMRQTSKAQDQTTKAQEQMDRVLDKYLGRSEEV
jgi:transcriptional regulator with XRE-family HTH domain